MDNRSSIVASAVWMMVISALLFFVPAINGLVGGAVGGYRAGTAKRALLAALLPSLAVGLFLWALFAMLNAPLIGFFGGMAAGAWALISSVSLLIGAAVGGAIAPKQSATAHG